MPKTDTGLFFLERGSSHGLFRTRTRLGQSSRQKTLLGKKTKTKTVGNGGSLLFPLFLLVRAQDALQRGVAASRGHNAVALLSFHSIHHSRAAAPS